MHPERWERIKELFEAALNRAEPERSSFLVQACVGDESLRREVESLLSAHIHASKFMQAPVFDEPAALCAQDLSSSTFAVDEVISGRFKVLRFIGRGGMGEVYEAHDLDRNARVALKTIRSEISSDPMTLARFKREIEMALRVAHPNVCRVHDLERHPPPEGSGKPEIVFLTMELLDGETLAARLQSRGKMKCQDALPLIRQMADGLAAAHSVGVIHCDFKPGNVMLVGKMPVAVDSQKSTQSLAHVELAPAVLDAAGGDLRAVITDFGLARAIRPTVTREGLQESLNTGHQLAGTLPYMAPEQLEGQPATAATDVYALGLVAYEMVTGRQPFSGTTPLAAAYKRLSESPPSPRTLAPDLFPSLESMILRCLQREPKSRFATANEALAALGESPRTGDRGWWKPAGALVRSAAITLGGLILSAVLIASIPQTRERAKRYLFPPAIPSRKNIVVLPFKASDAPAEDRARCDGLTETVTARLVEVASLQVASAEFVLEHHIADIDSARRWFGANLALSASWQHEGQTARIVLSLVDTATGQTLGSDTVDAAVGDVFSLQDQVVLHAVRMLQVQLSAGERKDLTTHGTGVLTAYDFYVQGIGYLQRYENPQNVDLAITLLQRAIAADANYAQPQAALAQAYLYKYNSTNNPQWVQQAKVAAKAAESLNSNLSDVQTAIGYLRHQTGDDQEALRPLQRATELDPNNVEAFQHLGQVYAALGRPVEAERALRSAILIRPACWSCYNELGIFLEDHDRFGESVQAYQKVIELTPDNSWGYTNLGSAYLYLGDFDRALEISRRGLNLEPRDPNAASNAAAAAFYMRRYEEDVRYSQEAIKMQPQQYSYWANLADAYRMMPGEADLATAAYRQAITLAKEQLNINPKDGEALSRLALFYARTGATAQAQHDLSAGLNINPNTWNTLEVACLVHLAAGDRQEALKWLAQAVRAGYPRVMLVADPELSELRPDPEFAKLAERARTYR
jgi:serine/threonine protein kinase/tetratricopeptide (TPR) repeat protein